MTIYNARDLDAFKLAREFKRQIYAIVRAHPVAFGDVKYRSQLWDAAASGESNIDEGFRRKNPGIFVNFLGYALGSMSEAVCRLEDGVDRGYFKVETIAGTVRLGNRALAASASLQRSQRRYAAELKQTKSGLKNRRAN